MGNKRRRIALSCVDCRRRKVKCDRTYPACVRCQKQGQADQCVYKPYEGTEASDVQVEEDYGVPAAQESSWPEEGQDWTHPHVTEATRLQQAPVTGVLSTKRAVDKSDNIARLEQKVAELEAQVAAARSSSLYAQRSLGLGIPTPASSIGYEASRNALEETEQTLLRGKSFKTQYYGPTHYGTILLQFDELSNFIKDITHHFPGLDRLSFKRRRNEHNGEVLVPGNAIQEHNILFDLVPDRATADVLVQAYLDNFETTYRVVHVPTFLQHYEAFWQAPQTCSTDFVVVLLLAMATIYCVYPPEQVCFLGRSSKGRDSMMKWIAACESWLNAQSKKHVTVTTYQSYVLLFFAKRMNGIKVKRGWANAGSLVRLAMAAGLHREASVLGSKVSAYDQEMRRRLWATILEIEILTAIDRGMPPSITAADWDCAPPSNLDDEEFSTTMPSLPPSRPYDHFTRTSCLCTSLQSAPLRLELLARINSVKQTLTTDLAAQYDVKIRQALVELPSWSPAHAGHSLHLSQTLPRLQLLEYIILLHQPFATSKDNPARHFFSRAATRDAAITILESYRNSVSDLDTPTTISPLFALFIRNDAFRAALSICHDISTAPSHSASFFDGTHATSLLESILLLQGTRAMQLGQGFHAYWIISSALSLVYTKQAQSQPLSLSQLSAPQMTHAEIRSKYAQEAANRVVALNNKIIALQEASVDGTRQKEVSDELLREATSVLAKKDMIPGRGETGTVGAELGEVSGPPPEVGFDGTTDFANSWTFNLADIWELDTFFDLGQI